jgi:oligosaccharide repeat unit polymerase
MYLFILVICLFLFLLFALIICNGDMLAPLPLSVESFLLVSMVASFFNGFSGVDISLYTIVIVMLALAVYAIGYILTRGMFQQTEYNEFSPTIKPLLVPRKKLSLFLLIVAVLIGYMSFRGTLELARTVDASATPATMLMLARNAELFNDIDRNMFGVMASFFLNALGYFYMFIIISNKTLREKDFKIWKNCKIELLIVLISVAGGILSTNRTFMIKIFVFILTLVCYLAYIKLKKRRYKIRESWKMTKTLSFVVIGFFFVFQLLGLTTGKTATSAASEMLYGYSGAAIVAFDRSVDIYEPDDRFFGEQSFYGLYGFLNALGVQVPNRILHLPFVSFEDGRTTNIYTSLHSYLYDFGFIGIYIVQFFLGIIGGAAYSMLKRFGKYPSYLFLYSLFLYGVVMQGIEDMALRDFMGITNIFIFLFFTIMCILDKTRFKISLKNGWKSEKL